MKATELTQKNSSAKTKFHKSTFEKTSQERRQKILDVAVAEFAANGYNGTNINVIARKAEISIGSMYSYFASKEDLFLSVVDRGFHVLEEALSKIDVENENIFDVFEKLLRASRESALKYPELNQVYLDVTTQGLASLSSRLSNTMESITARLYSAVIQKAKKEGILSSDADEQLISFCLDNLIIMFQFSYTSNYYKERMKIFLGADALEDEERLIQGVMTFIRKALTK